MELKSGYKQTEAGVIPEDWTVSTVGGEFDIKLGKMLDSEKNIGVQKRYLGNKAVQWGHINTAELSTMPMSRGDLERFRLLRGDLLVCEGGEVGRAAIWESPIEECYYQKALHRLRPIRGFNSRLMVAMLRYWADHGLLTNHVTQTSIAHLTREKFAEVPLPVPQFIEQTAIANALSDADALIQSLQKLIAKNRQIKQGAMQTLFDPFEKGKLKTGWVAKKLGEVSAITRGASPRPINNPVWFDEKSKIGWVRISDVTNSAKTLRNTTQNLSELGIRHSRFVGKGSLIMSICATVGRPILTEIDVCIHDGFVVFNNLQINQEYLYYFLSFIEDDWSKNGQTGSQMNLNTGLINGIEINFPKNIENQARIATILSDMDADITALETKLAKYQKIKQGMMQNLLTGRIRLT